MKIIQYALILTAGILIAAGFSASRAEGPNSALGLPAVPYPDDNPPTPEKITLGEKLFNDERFSSTGEVSCATCHLADALFTDSPLKVSEGILGLTGTRNAPSVVNAVFFKKFFWDGRSPTLEDQALHPFTNPVEMGLEDHQPILDIVRSDPDYVKQFAKVFGKDGNAITMTEVTRAIASFERTLIGGDSPFDRWYFGGDPSALTDAQKRGFNLFLNEGRCVSCHIVEQTQALFTDNRFHNIGVGINDIQDEVPGLASRFLHAEATASEVNVQVLTDKRTSELGRFAITRGFDDLGSFKTPTLRNIALSAPYMHDGSLETLKDVVVHYNNGGVTDADSPVNDFLSGGIRPLALSEKEIDDLVTFMEALTSTQYAAAGSTGEK